MFIFETLRRRRRRQLDHKAGETRPTMRGVGRMVVGFDGRLREADGPAAAMTGLGQAGALVADNLEDGDRSRWAIALGGLSAGDGNEAALRLRLGDRSLECLLSAGPMGVDVLVIDRDLFAHGDDAPNAAPKAGDEDERARAAALSALADVSHEMRTPLNAVIGFADAMRNETFGPLGHEKYAEYAQHVASAGEHLLGLASSVLDLARHDAGRATLNKALCDPARLAREAAAMVEPLAEAAGLSFELDIDPCTAQNYIDPQAFRQILINLLSNAVKFTNDGGVRMRLSQEAGAICVVIRDTGVGMSETELAALGARFTAAQSRGVRGVGGAGLGLALAHTLAEAHGGVLKLSSEPGEGVRAMLRLPLADAPSRGRVNLFSAAEDGREVADGKERPLQSQLDRIDAYRRDIAARRRAA